MLDVQGRPVHAAGPEGGKKVGDHLALGIGKNHLEDVILMRGFRRDLCK